MNSTKQYNDYELLYLISESSEDATNLLYEKYKEIVDLKIKKYLKYGSIRGLDYNDLFQEGMIGLSEAIRDFRNEKDVKFSTFANLCIERQIHSALKKAGRMKHKFLNESMSLDVGVDENDRPWIESLFDKKEKDPSEILEQLENSDALQQRIREELTDFEQQVLELKLGNFDYKEIAELLGKSYKSVDSAMQRIKMKLKKKKVAINN